MAEINKSSATRPAGSTGTGPTNNGTWTLVRCAPWARYASGINNLTVEIALRTPPPADGAAYSASDDQVIVPAGAAWTIPLSPGRSKADAPTFAVRTAASQTFHFLQGG